MVLVFRDAGNRTAYCKRFDEKNRRSLSDECSIREVIVDILHELLPVRYPRCVLCVKGMHEIET